ncbi:MAG: hypothetical protein U0797_20515 [Gemmataceae bacterium]
MNRLFLIVSCLALGRLGLLFAQHLSGPCGNEAPAGAIPELVSYRDIVRRLLPAVVSVEPRRRTAARRRPNDMALAQRPERFLDVPHLDEGDDEATGSVRLRLPWSRLARAWSSRTSTSSRGPTQVRVLVGDGRKFTSTPKTIRTDPKTDLAIVQARRRRPAAAPGVRRQ